MSIYSKLNNIYANINQGVVTGLDGTFNNLTVSNNFTVNGTQTIINTNILEIEDPIITVNKTANANQSGLEVYRGEGNTNSRIYWDENLQTWMSGLIGLETQILSIANNSLTLNKIGTSLFSSNSSTRPSVNTINNGELHSYGCGVSTSIDPTQNDGFLRLSGGIFC